MSKFLGTLKHGLQMGHQFAVRMYHLPVLHPVLRTSGHTVLGFVRDDCHIMAAAIAYYAVLSLIPFMLLLVSFAGFFLNNMGKEFADQQALFAHLETYIRAVIPFLSSDILDRLREATLHRQAIGFTGLVILLITAGLVFRTLEISFSKIFKQRRRSALVSQMLFVVFAMAVGLTFLGVHYVGILTSSFFSGRDEQFSSQLQQFLMEHELIRVVISVATATIVFTILLKYFARGLARLKYILPAGLLFSGLWLLASRLFGYYLTHLARFSLLYGSLATLAIIVVWIFYSACILLLCAEFASVLQRDAAINEEGGDRSSQ